MTVKPKPTISPSLAQRIAEARATMEHQRLAGTDPEAAWQAFVRATFDRTALSEAYQDYLDGRRDADAPDDATRDDGR